MFTVMLSFVVLLTPHRLWELFSIFRSEDLVSLQTEQFILQLFSIMYVSNSIINPLICCLCSEVYRLVHLNQPLTNFVILSKCVTKML